MRHKPYAKIFINQQLPSTSVVILELNLAYVLPERLLAEIVVKLLAFSLQVRWHQNYNIQLHLI